MKKIISLLVLSFIIISSTKAQNLYTAELQKNSSLTITGSTNLLSFKLYQKDENLLKNKLIVAVTQSQNKLFLSQNQLTVLVNNFLSTNPMALKDFLKLVKSDIYPTLQVQINYLDLQPISDKEQVKKGSVLASIKITGVTKFYTIPILFSSNGDIYTVNGNKKISIRDFGLTPQNKMMGIIKVSEWIDIDFHMNYKITSEKNITKL
ncbi:hypothetical protein [Flavobacterium cellulosilyticum]|uniref:YceI family protein n=1 Tax=Flavobacterium cellulosilyticum TaxID=2541731 RepID=A0A4R5CF69_9FLAO|nr:hypothetical protein [Flavobacterium cellulosilyticum]TDD98721.1 hypothetical protein E0F76_06230 [Flavobacterium cellulosilyticum]